MNGIRIGLISFALTSAAIAIGAPTTKPGWERWTGIATAVATAVEDSDPEAIEAACRLVPGSSAGLPGWTQALSPLCRATYTMTTMSEMPARQLARVCADGRRSMTLLTQAMVVPAFPAAAPIAQRLRAAWDKEYAISCR